MSCLIIHKVVNGFIVEESEVSVSPLSTKTAVFIEVGGAFGSGLAAYINEWSDKIDNDNNKNNKEKEN